MSTYVCIFGACYLTAAVPVLRHWSSKNRVAAARFYDWPGNPQENIAKFHRTMVRESWLILLWSTFFFGSIAGVIASLIYWLLS
jgi:hypothetical protein